MPERRALFRQRDVERALKAARRAGLVNPRVEIAPDGTIAVLASPAEPAAERGARGWEDADEAF